MYFNPKCFTGPTPTQINSNPSTNFHFLPVSALSFSHTPQVYLCRHNQTGEYAALKVLHLQAPERLQDPEHLKVLLNEAAILETAKHPVGIVQVKDVIRDAKQVVIVQEWLQGGHIMDELNHLGHQYSETHAAEMCFQLAATLHHLHSLQIIHRDLKPENIMFRTSFQQHKEGNKDCGVSVDELQKKGWGVMTGLETLQIPPVVIIDLGMAARIPLVALSSSSSSSSIEEKEKQKQQQQQEDTCDLYGPLGSAGFIAPEVIQGAKHSPAMDIFSLGVIMFILLVGRKPFNIAETANLSYAKMDMKHAAPGLQDPRWAKLSPDARHLLLMMLQYDPEKRITAAEVLCHPWVVHRGGSAANITNITDVANTNATIGTTTINSSSNYLGLEVAHGAATVGSLRRLKNMSNGVMVFNRAAAAAAAPDSETYRRMFLSQVQRIASSQERSTRGGGGGGGGFMERSARRLAAKSFTKVHDRGGSIDPAAAADIESVYGEKSQRGGNSMMMTMSAHPIQMNGGGDLSIASSTASSFKGYVPTMKTGAGAQMHRSGTAIFLSEMDRDGIATGGSSMRMYKSGSANNLSASMKMLRSSIRLAIDVNSSRHGSSAGVSRDPSLYNNNASVVFKNKQQQQQRLPPMTNVHGDKDVNQSTPRTISAADTRDRPLRVVVKKGEGSTSAGGSSAVSRNSRDGNPMSRKIIKIKPLDT
jgi:serine/threonine protein kinase